MIGRIPILDVEPAVDCGRRPAKAVTGETFQVSATVFREGHGIIGAGVVLREPGLPSRGGLGGASPLAVPSRGGPRGVRGAEGVWGERFPPGSGGLGGVVPPGGAGSPRADTARPMVPMRLLAPGSDRYGADVTVTCEGLWRFQVEAWADPIASWAHDVAIKVRAGQDVELMLAEGALLFERAARRIPQPPGAGRPAAARATLRALVARMRDRGLTPWERLAPVEDPAIDAILDLWPLRELVTRSRPLTVQVDRERALFGSWYEFFPRSEGAQVDPRGRRPPVSGTLRTAARRLDAIAAMEFDVVYLPPVHPIGTTFRKGMNNTLSAAEGDPGSPWAIGSPEGGHDAIHPDLGTFADFDAFVARTRELGMEVALDLALQASPDHPWAKEHPEWFTTRADGSIAYAENPPKKYQDIYPLNFDHDPEGIYAEVLRIVRLWMDHGVRIFRVDNPHTKPLRFWERLLAEIRRTDPDVLFLAEAFTRPAMMRALAMIGFHQSYTYFTWRNGVWELTEYLRELSGPSAPYMRPNFFANTPDILTEYLQHGGIAAFKIRAVLASMLSPTWGIYSGYELGERVPVRPGSEEYMHSEKYEYRPRDWKAAAANGTSIADYITALNRIRRAHPALHRLRNLRFHRVDQPELLCFSKREDRIHRRPGALGSDTVLVVVNLDPYHTREATVWLDLPELGVDGEVTVIDELTGDSYQWGPANYVRLDPETRPAHIFSVTPGP